MLIAIPAAVGIGVLARPVIQLLFPQKESMDMASRLLTALAMTVVFYSLSTLTNSVLQGIGKVNMPVKNAAAALVLQTGVLACLISFTGLDLYALVIAELIYSGTMCILNQRALHKYMDYRQEIFYSFITPIVSSAFMGVVAWGVYKGMHLLTSSNILSLLTAVMMGAATYFVLEIVLKGVSEAELRALPKGYLLVKLAKKCRMM